MVLIKALGSNVLLQADEMKKHLVLLLAEKAALQSALPLMVMLR